MRAFVVDAFTDSAFGGNPAGVVLVDAPVGVGWMQSVAAELRHSETAFVGRRADGTFDLRWFTPMVEVDLCGHATLATAHVLASLGELSPLTFHTRSGDLGASVVDGAVTLDFPAQPPRKVDVPLGLEPALGIELDRAWSNDVDLLLLARSVREVRSLQPDLGVVSRLPYRGLVVTARAGDGDDHDFVSRFFAPRVGVPEDPVTGSAHCMLGPFWSERLGRTSLVGVQLSDRRGRVEVDMRGSRVALRGTAVTVLAGDLLC